MMYHAITCNFHAIAGNSPAISGQPSGQSRFCENTRAKWCKKCRNPFLPAKRLQTP